MKFLVIGLGSMGKRRIRCLQAMGKTELYGFDLREDRRIETTEKYGIRTFGDFKKALDEVSPDAIIISVPPDVHHLYIKEAIKYQKHFFVEASVVDTDMDDIKNRVQATDIVAAPSATMVFHPAIQQIAKLVHADDFGKISNIVLHSGQYLPNWHTYEHVKDYYVSNPPTGGGREIVPFELTWVTHIFGFPQRVCGNFRKTIEIVGAENIEDTYNCLLDYGDFLASITVDVVSRHAMRRLLINGSKKQLVWDWDYNCIKLFDAESGAWSELPYEMKGAADGYNPNIGENMYIDELKNFIQAVEGKATFVNTMENDHKVLLLLYAIEKADKTSQYVRFTL